MNNSFLESGVRGFDSRMAQPEVLDSVVYETCVIGSGLFGSSSAKYAAEDGSTILIGPSEEARLKVDGVNFRQLEFLS